MLANGTIKLRIREKLPSYFTHSFLKSSRPLCAMLTSQWHALQNAKLSP